MGAAGTRARLLVYKVDRFGRSVRNCLDGIVALGSHSARLVAVSQSIDTDHTNPTARLLLHILASVAEFERELYSATTSCKQLVRVDAQYPLLPSGRTRQRRPRARSSTADRSRIKMLAMETYSKYYIPDYRTRVEASCTSVLAGCGKSVRD
jgi:DNA invertase Pin-like site-specific DNA recombinase